MNKKKKSQKKSLWFQFSLISFVVLVAILFLGKNLSLKKAPPLIDAYKPFSPKIIESANVIPIQSGGRIKPLRTYAYFLMMELYGSRKMKIQNQAGVLNLSATEWLLDVLFRPQVAQKLPTFMVQNTAVLKAIGINEIDKRRGRYSYMSLLPVKEKLYQLGSTYLKKQDKQNADPLPLLEQQILNLAQSFSRFERLLHHFDFARYPIDLVPLEGKTELVSEVKTSTWLATLPLWNHLNANKKVLLEPPLKQFLNRANLAKSELNWWAEKSPNTNQLTWISMGEILEQAVTGKRTLDTTVAQILLTEKLFELQKQANEAQFIESFQQWSQRSASLSDKLNKTLRIENDYYQKQWLYKALIFFIIGSFGAVLSWLSPRDRWGRYWRYFSWSMSGIAFVLGVLAIVNRTLITHRPPVGNLYDTIPFITIVAAGILLWLEYLFNRRKKSATGLLGLASLVGILGLFLARRYELGESSDNLDPLVAVLNSNFWLSIHVLTIVMGYAAGLLTSALSHAYLIMRFLKLDRGDNDFRRLLTRMVYGCVCFTLFFSLVGTVLGGIWANDSWGRFWGWDPKENGALMIVLWNLIILHARLGGYIKEQGLHLCTILGGCVVVFSWWHVNFLGVGLHSYGFTSGQSAIWWFYLVEATIVVFTLSSIWFHPSREAK